MTTQQLTTARAPGAASTDRHGWVLALMSAAAFMAVLDTLVVTTALTTIQHAIRATPEQLGWTVNAYTLALAVSILPAAALGDRYGRRRVLVVGLTLFSLCSAACALAPSIGPLIAARAAQGVGAATVMPLTLAILGATFPPAQRGRAIGVWGGLTGLAVAAGPLIGGAVVQGLGWQWIFWINVVLGVVLVPLIVRHVPESRGPGGPLDLPGLALVALGALGLVWGLVRGNASGWTSPEILTALLGGAALLTAFVLWELRTRTPMLPMPYFRSRAFSAGHAAGFLMTASLFGAVFLMAQYFQIVGGDDPLAAGLRLLPWTATPMVVAPIAGNLSDRIGERWILASGLALQAAGLAFVALTAGTSPSYAALAVGLVAAGVGISMALPTVQTVILGAVPPSGIGKAAGSSNTFRQLGGAFGIALALALFTHYGALESPARFAAGFRPAVAALAVLSLLGAVAGACAPSRSGSLVTGGALTSPGDRVADGVAADARRQQADADE
ncbi:DHA2 family efflux MFS transporter permease subunit [Streptacidiphilus jiangxiensis]|uniref:Drug resistance transporter, EmrB/QacA subfamily n=1 Tax=Streptacidiphilus jiangxiensis TaxID=235985 RepID=A0A1H7WMG7_STRJI|nr:DHA2 family efflux MFS transporter permease subunit [Streptacidiphilus jiangxiensis]SEM22822.1 drug resistance transporter, EmrB/QacA subfamily [Streptacidiphilus jiangxiensis]